MAFLPSCANGSPKADILRALPHRRDRVVVVVGRHESNLRALRVALRERGGSGYFEDVFGSFRVQGGELRAAYTSDVEGIMSGKVSGEYLDAR